MSSPTPPSPPDYRRQTGTRPPTQGQWTKPGFFFPSPANPESDYGLIENKTVDSKEKPIAYLTQHPLYSNLLLTKQTYDSAEDGKKSRTRIYRTLPGYKTTRYAYDDEIDAIVAIDEQDVAIGTDAPTDALLLDFTDTPTDQGWISRTTIRLAALPNSRTEYVTEQFTFPALLESVSGVTRNVGRGNVEVAEDTTEYQTGINTLYIITPVIRPPITAPTTMRVVTSFHSSQPTKDEIYVIAPNNPRFSGRLIDFNFGEVLNDSFTLDADAGTYDNALWGHSESVEVGASVPTCTAYKAAIDTEKLIASDVKRYRGKIWIKQNTYVTLR